ncbi:hypothetical protein F5Y14DRAFT_412007 [Nemania sp. NC0429]|nr:hypothetical protein F5Y14DRAFT_412007 [Nemania sp. NC0429]
MAPLTRRAAKAQGESQSPTEEQTKTPSTEKKEAPFDEPIAVRSRRKASDDAAEEENENDGTTAESAQAATPRRKKLEVRVRDDNVTSVRSTIEVHIPSSAVKTPRLRSSPVRDSQEPDTDTDASEAANQTLEPLSASKQLEEEATQKLASEARLGEFLGGLESSPLSKPAKPARASSGKKTRVKQTKKPKNSRTEPEPEAEEVTPKPKATTKSKHVVFGGDDDVDKFVTAAAEKEKEKEKKKADEEEEEEEEDDDDEAPEAVSTTAAAKETLKAAKAAIEAAEKYAESTKRKRQARDNLLKQQAAKRKRARPNTTAKGGSSEDGSEDEAQEEDEEEEARNVMSKRPRRTQQTLPDVLPAEFLTDSSEDEAEADGTALKKMVKRPQKITFETAVRALGAEGRAPRDEVVGSTRYRVLAGQGDERLAPKANKEARRAKEALLRRGRPRVETAMKRGFFVKKR